MRQGGWWTALAVLFLGMSNPGYAAAQQSAGGETSNTNVQTRDEAGRRPFQQSGENGTCEEAPACQVTFKTVPPSHEASDHALQRFCIHSLHRHRQFCVFHIERRGRWRK